jgi:hypothetical protein
LPQDDGTLSFRLQDEHGRYRSNNLRIHRVWPQTFTRRFLLWKIKTASYPDEGQPRLPGGD